MFYGLALDINPLTSKLTELFRRGKKVSKCTVMCCSLYVIKTSTSVIIKSWVSGPSNFLVNCRVFGHNELTHKVSNSSGVDR
jgi:hypothetical protein